MIKGWEYENWRKYEKTWTVSCGKEMIKILRILQD
jgi:hypothetical protein